MKEERINLETAKLAKEKGFNIVCNSGYFGDYGELEMDSYPFLGTYTFLNGLNCDNSEENNFACPTQSLLQKWLRETHNIDIRIFRNYQYMVKNKGSETEYYDDAIHTTYEEALEAGLQAALNLIKL